MANNVRFVDNVAVSAYGNTGTGDTSVSSSYAETASFAHYATSASYAISASHEIIKEVSSSYADTASFAQSGNGIFSGSFSGSYVGDGSSLTGVVGEWDGSHLGDASITGSLYLISGSFYWTQNPTINNIETFNIGGYAYSSGSGGEDPGVIISQSFDLFRVTSSFSTENGIHYMPNLNINGPINYTPPSGDSTLIVNFGTASYGTNSNPTVYFRGHNYIQGHANISGSEGNITVSSLVPSKPDEGSVGTLSKSYDKGYINNLVTTNITSSGDISGSASSTASFGTYLGDGSQLTGIETDPFPFSGSAVITGSLVVSGSGVQITGSLDVDSAFIQTITPKDGIFIIDSPNAGAYGNFSFQTYTPSLGAYIKIKYGADEIVTKYAANQAYAFGKIGDTTNSFEFNGGGNPNFSLLDTVFITQGATQNNALKITGSVLLLGENSHITASGNVSSSAASTASFGTYLGDGSQLTGITSNPFPFTGDAQITGSLIISGSFITSRNSDLSNTIIGSSSAAAMNSGATGNVIIGNETAKSLTSGDDNVIIGENAGQSITSGYDNVYIGHNSGLQSHPTNAIGNVVIGVDAGLGSGGGTAYRNVFVGGLAGYNVDGANNVYVGNEAGRGEAGADGTANSGFGAFALTDNRDGNYNIGIGYYAGGAIKDGSNNIFIGSGSLGELSTEAQLRIGHADLITISASLATGDIIFPSTASAAYFVGDGSQLSGISTTPFPFSGSAVITGSLVVSGSSKPLEIIGSGSTVFSVVGSLGELFAIDDVLSGSLLVINDASGIPQFEVFSDGRTLIGASPRSLYTTATISATAAATSESIYSLSTSSYDGVFFDYTVTSASNARAGNIMSIWNGGSLVYTENTTTDIGSTTGVIFNVEISQSQAQLISVTDTAGWKIKTTIRSI